MASQHDITPHLLGMVEAALFATGTPLSAKDIGHIVGEDSRKVKKAIEILIERYERQEGALEIGLEDGYILQVKSMYSRVIEALVPLELTQGVVRTLSVIALKQPLIQSDLIDLRGASAYDHVKDLLEKGLIIKEPEGRSFILRTSPKFDGLFKVNPKTLREFAKIKEPEPLLEHSGPEQIRLIESEE